MSKKLKFGLIVIVSALALLDLSSYLVLRFHLLNGFLKKIDVLEYDRNPEAAARNYDLIHSSNSARGGMLWTNYYVPPVRLSNVSTDPNILVNRYRRVKLNDDPKDSESIDPNAYKILLTGNSTGMGLGASKNSATFAAVLQKELQATFGKRVQVLNFCIPDYKFTDELIAFVVRNTYIKPDLWLVFNGDNDSTSRDEKLPTSMKYLVQRRRFDKFLLSNSFIFLPHFQKVMTLVFSLKSQEQIVDDLFFSSEEAFLQDDTSIFLENLKLASALANVHKTRLVHVLQPIMNVDMHQSSEAEVEHARLIHSDQGDQMTVQRVGKFKKFYVSVRKGMEQLQKTKDLTGNPTFLNIDDVFLPAGDRPVYFDSRHYNDLGHQLVAEKLFRLLSPMIKADLAKNKK